MGSKRGRPKGAKTWHKTRGQEEAFDYAVLRRLGSSTSDAMDDVSKSWHIEPESVLRSFYRHKSTVDMEIDDDQFALLAIVVLEKVSEVLAEIPSKLLSKIQGISDERMARIDMQSVFIEEFSSELRQRTADICPGAEAQQLINEFVDSFLAGYTG